jgi:hypothetical protein
MLLYEANNTEESHDHAASDAVWVVKRYEPEQHLVQFYKVEPGEKLGVIEVQCSELNESLAKGWTRQTVKILPENRMIVVY